MKNKNEQIYVIYNRRTYVYMNDITATLSNLSIDTVKANCDNWIDSKFGTRPVYTAPGSVVYLLYGRIKSDGSINSKTGQIGEYIAKELVKINPTFTLMQCGKHKIADTTIDIDLLFKDETNKILYYYELKGNVNLDIHKYTENLKIVHHHKGVLSDAYPDYTIQFGILNWSVYNKSVLPSSLVSKINDFEKNIS